MSAPRNRTSPSSTETRPASMRPMVDLPEPDSPTSPTVSPRRMSNDTPLTAGNCWAGPNHFPLRTYVLRRFFTVSKASG
ncbi:hypothetical protein G6F45_014070 [Rhizopus arrhizus]|nr:hypothetical protein G6F45_014070 [Rhizopus arrhizus]